MRLLYERLIAPSGHVKMWIYISGGGYPTPEGAAGTGRGGRGRGKGNQGGPRRTDTRSAGVRDGL